MVVNFRGNIGVENKKIVPSLVYKFVERLLVKALGLIISIILARLIVPDDFGQLAILTVFINISQTFIQGGLNTALVQSKQADDRDYATVYYISTVIALILLAVLYFCAPIISNYYGSDALVWPLRAYAFSLVFAAFNSVQVAKLQREMNFRAMMYSSLIATVVSGVVGIMLAYLNFGLWALVVYNAAYVVFSCIAMLFVAKWVPKFCFSFERAKRLFSFGWKMLISAILCSVYNDIRTLIIGKRFSTEDLAYYNRGHQFPTTITHTLDMTIQSVMFPAMASCQDNREQVKSILKRTIVMGNLLVIPITIGLFATSESIVALLLGEQWLPCVEYMQIICIAEASVIFTSSNLVAIKSIGRSDVYMKLEFVRRIAMVVVLLISVFAFSSVKAIVVGFLISAWLDYVIIMFPVRKLVNYGILEQIKDVWRIIVASVCMGAVTYTISWIGLPMLLELIVQIIVGVAFYLLLCKIFKIEGFDSLKNFFKRRQ